MESTETPSVALASSFLSGEVLINSNLLD